MQQPKVGSERIKHFGRDEGLSLARSGPALLPPRRLILSQPEHVADAIQTWFEEGAADGFHHQPLLPDVLQYYHRRVVPVLPNSALVSR